MTYAKDDAQWSLLVKSTGMCAFPNCPGRSLQAHHVFRRSLKSVRLLVENGVCLCHQHHRLLERLPPTQQKQVYMLLVGVQRYADVEALSRTLQRGS